MKKFVSGVLVLVTIAAAAFFFLKVRRFGSERSRGAELAPAETILFAHLPDLRGTGARFLKTSLFAIWQEPEVQEFVAKPRRMAPTMRVWDERLARLAEVAPGEAFIAVTSLDGPQPRFVAGFSYAGNRRDAEGLMAEPREELKRLWPAGKSDSTTHKGAAIETFTYPQGTLAECFVRNWYFVASDVTLLRATLDRYEKPDAPTTGALAGNDAFQQATAPLGRAPDILLFAETSALSRRLGGLMPATWRPAPDGDAAGAKEVRAIAACTRIEGTQMHDTIFILSPETVEEAPLARSTIALGGSETLLYFATGITALAQLPETVATLATALPGIATFDRALVDQKLGWDDFEAAFGPEMGAMMEWPDDAAVPVVFLTVDVRDAAKAREFAEAVASGGPGAPAWERHQASGVAYYSAPVEAAKLANPVIAITPRFALLGFSVEAVDAVVRRVDASGAGNVVDSPFTAAATQIAVPTSAFGYLDAGAFFERAYRTLRPALAMSLAFSGELGDYIDAGRLPDAQTISQHLTPSVYSQSAAPGGILIESTGTLTFNQVIIGTIAAGAAAIRTREVSEEAAPSIESAPEAITPQTTGVGPLREPPAATPVDPELPSAPVVDDLETWKSGRP